MASDIGNALMASIMRGVASSSGDERTLTLADDVQILRLREMLKDYQDTLKNGVRFKAGDIVTPMKQYSYRGVGQPFIVLETRNDAEPNWLAEDTSSRNGRRLNMRVSNFLDNDNITTFWVEAFEFEYFPKD